MITENSAVYYLLTSDIDCVSIQFITIGSNETYFKGTLDGNGKTIKNLKINSVKDYTGIFAYGQGARVINLILQDVSINSNSSYVGTLFGNAVETYIYNVRLISTNQNKIISSSSNYTSFVGGFAGNFDNGTIFNCTLSNTFINSPNAFSIGGFFGSSYNLTMTKCFNLGNTDAKTMILFGYSSVGGLVGFCSVCLISDSGLQQGRISSMYGFTGGIAGMINQNTIISQIYSRSATIDAPIFAGGLIGMLMVALENTSVIVENVYSTSNVSATTNAGGLIGAVNLMNTNLSLSFKDCYTSSYVSGTSYQGSIIGDFTEFYPNTSSLTFENVYYNNETYKNPLPVGRVSVENGSMVNGYNCNNLFYEISLNFDKSVWGNNRLVSEYNYQKGTNDCISPKTCYYTVDNCLNCDPNPTVVDTNIFNVFCNFSSIENKWIWIFSNKTSDTIINQNQLVINNTTYIIGDFSQTNDGDLVFYVSETGSKLNVTGCVSINGTLSVVVSQKPGSENTVINLINYNCNSSPSVTSNQVQVKPTYSKGNCDKYNANTVVTQNSLSVSLNFAGGSCGLSRKAILGIAIGVGVGVPVALGLVFLFVIVLLRKKQQLQLRKTNKKFNKTPKDEFIENKNYSSTGGTKWQNNDVDL